MMRLRVLLFIVLGVASIAAAQSVYSPGQQTQPAEATGDITLSGTVVNSVTGEAIPRALVQMGGMQARSVLTDGAGKFRFDDLPEMQAFLTARKPGYFNDQELSRGMRTKTILVTKGMGPVTISLTPAGVIAGHVTTPDGDPIEGVFLQLKMRSIVQGRQEWSDRGGARSDEDGAFRIANLQPGKYYLFTNGSARMTGAPDVAFAPAYYPGVADVSGAAPIQVQAGQTLNADLTLQAEKAYHVAGVVTGLPPGQMAVVRVVGSGDEMVPFQSAVARDGSFEIPRIPAGTYTLEAMSRAGMGYFGGMGGGGRPGSNPPQNYTGSTRINVSGNVSGVTIALQPTANIPISVTADFANPQSNNSYAITGYGNSQRSFRMFVQVMLQRTDRPGGYVSQPDQNGNMAVRDVEPGKYRVEFSPMGGNTYVQSATWGNTDLLHDELVIAGGGEQQPINIAMRDDAASITGTADCGDTQCWVLVVADRSTLPPRQVYVGPNGTFQAMGLPPGSYRLYAFDRLDGVEYTNADAMKQYDGTAENVVLSAGQKAQISLELTKVVDQ